MYFLMSNATDQQASGLVVIQPGKKRATAQQKDSVSTT
jgi:hypothetical protein